MSIVSSTVEYILLLALLAAAILSMGGCATMHEASGATFQSEKRSSGKDSTPPPEPATLYATARIFQAQNNDRMAEVVLMGLVRDFPEFSLSYNDLAGIRIERGAFKDASAVLLLGLEYTPNDDVLLNNAGVCALFQHDYERAALYFQKAYSTAPNHARYQANLALAMGMVGDSDRARMMFARVLPAEDADYNIELILNMLATSELNQEETEHLVAPSGEDFSGL